nr:probable E3 ubiquitin-protein ligase RNF217 [Ipomoea batatas]
MGNTLRTLSRRSEQRQETPPARLDPEDRAQNEPFTCEICIEPMLSPRKFKNRDSCSHPFCSDCIVKYIAVKLECNAAKIQCPALDCGEFLDPIACRTLLGPQLFVKCGPSAPAARCCFASIASFLGTPAFGARKAGN